MSISLMQLSCGDYSIDEGEIRKEAETDEGEGVSMRRGMDLQKEEEELELELELEFKPLEHPIEPPDEDRPVQCPMPHSSIINVDGRVRERKVGESSRKRGEEAKAGINKEGMTGYERGIGKTGARWVRKRHHNLIRGGDHQILTPYFQF